MSSYKDFIFHDELVDIDYLDWGDYMENKKLFSGSNLESEYIIQCLINGDIVSDIRDINNRLFTIYVAIDYIFSDSNFNDREYILWREKIHNLYFDLENDYNDSKNNTGSWKYINLTIDDLYNDISKEYKFASTIPLEKLFAEDYYTELMHRNMEEN